jgi:hypothetical protein
LCARTIVVVGIVSTVDAGALTVCLILTRLPGRRRPAAAAAMLGDGHPRRAQRQPCGDQNHSPAVHWNYLVPGASAAFAKLERSSLRLREDLSAVVRGTNMPRRARAILPRCT